MKPEFSYYRENMKDKLGRCKTNSLFWETKNDSEVAMFTIKDYNIERDGIKYPSLKLIYMSYDHVPEMEYEFALDVFGSWNHWVRLSNASFRDVFQEWRNELAIRNKANAIKSLISVSRQENNKAMPSACRYLAEAGYEVKKGRPSKDEIARQLKIASGVRETLDEDMERLGLSLIKNEG